VPIGAQGIEKMLGVEIDRLTEPLSSLSEMNMWFNDNVKCHFHDKNGCIQRIAAAFVQAKADDISILALIFSVFEA